MWIFLSWINPKYNDTIRFVKFKMFYSKIFFCECLLVLNTWPLWLLYRFAFLQGFDFYLAKGQYLAESRACEFFHFLKLQCSGGWWEGGKKGDSLFPTIPSLSPRGLTQSLSILALYDTRDELGTGQWRLYLENNEVVVMNWSNGTCFSFLGR